MSSCGEKRGILGSKDPDQMLWLAMGEEQERGDYWSRQGALSIEARSGGGGWQERRRWRRRGRIRRCLNT
jgi:hypothetical protein